MDHRSAAHNGEPAADRGTGFGSRRRFFLVAVGCFVALLGVAGWQVVIGARADVPQRSRPAQTGGSGTGLTLYRPGERVAAPGVRGETLSGAQLALAILRGRVVVLNVWGSWCNPCRAETPELVRVFRDTQARGVRFAGIDTRDNPDAARAFVRSFHVPYPSLIDRDGKLLLALKGLIPAYAVPSVSAGKITCRNDPQPAGGSQ